MSYSIPSFRSFSCLIISSLAGLLLLQSCAEEPSTVLSPELEAHIAATTVGVISAYDEVVVQLVEDLGMNIEAGQEASVNLFEFDPSVVGRTIWKSPNTLAFVPEEPLASGMEYKVTFKLGEIKDVEEVHRRVDFYVKVIEQGFSLASYRVEPLNDGDYQWNTLRGEVLSEDASSFDEVSARIGIVGVEGVDPGDLTWTTQAGDKRTWRFAVDSVERLDVARNWYLRDGGERTDTLRIPSLHQFEFLRIATNQLPDQYVSLTFSMPIFDGQQLEGMFQLDGVDVEHVKVDGSVVRLYVPEPVVGNVKVSIAQGLLNTAGDRLPHDLVRSALFSAIKPEVRFVGDGHIVPSAGGANLQIEAASLSAIDVKVFRVFSENLHQFFQVNNLSGASQLRRVALPIAQKRVELSLDKATGSWQNYSIDLGDLVEADPGAVYRVELGFKPSYSMYPCNAVAQEKMISAWGAASSLQGWWQPDGYSYRERKNPCDVSYYVNRTVAKNVLVSDVGLVVKSGGDAWRAYVSDLTTGAAVAGAQVELMNFQGRRMVSGTTDAKGAVTLQTNQAKPFMAVATVGVQRGYVKLQSGESLSVSGFDVGGVDVEEGVQMLLYTERGMWRPGDTVFLNGVLDDISAQLPETLPITLQVTDPQGKLMTRRVQQRGTGRILPFHFSTGVDAPTGTYSVAVQVGAKTYRKSIPVETILPNRLDIALSVEGGASGADGKAGASGRIDASSTDVPAQLNVVSEWLTGAPASGFKYEIKGKISKDPNAFDDAYEDYDFFNYGQSVTGLGDEVLAEGILDVKGRASAGLKLPYMKNNPGPLVLAAHSRVYEPSGRFSMNSTALKLSPFKAYVGMKLPAVNSWGYLESKSAHRIDLVRLDADGEPEAGRVKVEVFELDWSWWWSHRSGRAARLNSGIERLVSTTEIAMKAGRGVFELALEDGQWGRHWIVVTDLESGHKTSDVVYLDWYSSRGTGRRDSPEVVEVLELSLDEEQYEVGEMAVLTVPSSAGGRLLLSLENGREQLFDKAVETQEGSTRVEFRVTEEMAPNVYAHVMLIQGQAQTENDLPIRMYGIEPVKVVNVELRLLPVVEAPETVKPHTELVVRVSEETGREMEYTLAVVDEGLLGLTNFRTPDPHAFFTRRQALGVRTWDLFGDVIGAFSGEISKVLSIGGDAALLEDKQEESDRFKPMLRHFGPFTLKAGARARHKIPIENYVGNLRVMVIAAGPADGGQAQATGNAEQNVVVKQPLMAQITLPRVVGPGEQVDIPVTLIAMEDGVGKVRVKLSTSSHLLVDAPVQTVELDHPGQTTVFFKAIVQSDAGVAEVSVEAGAARFNAQDRLQVEVRNPLTTQRRSQASVVSDTYSTSVTPFGLPGTGACSISISAFPDMQLENRVAGLIGYPHGCLEQTTSKGFAQMHLGAWVELTADQQKRLKENVRATLNKIRGRQMTSGGFRYWPSSREVSVWGSTYAGQFIVAARDAGYDLPPKMLEEYLRYEKKAARQWSFVSGRRWQAFSQAYRLYVLAKAGKAELGAMTRLKNTANLPVNAQVLLSAAYAVVGEQALAQALLKDVGAMENIGGYYTYGSALRNNAMLIEAHHLSGNKELAMELAMALADGLAEGWHSTQTFAYSLNVLTTFYGGSDERSLDMTLTIDGASQRVSSTERVMGFPVEGFGSAGSRGATEISVENHSDSPLHVRVTHSAIPACGEEVAFAEGLELAVEYTDGNGDLLDLRRVVSGTTLYARVKVMRVGGASSLARMALTQIVPSGWEISNARVSGLEAAGPGTSGTSDNEGIIYQDIRDDRVLTYFDMRVGKVQFILCEMTAAYPGRFYLPPVYVEAMYDGALQAATKGRWIEIVMD